MNKLLDTNFNSDISLFLPTIILICFLVFIGLFIFNASKNKWTIRKANQYALLSFIILSTFSFAMVLNVFIAFFICMLYVLLLRINDNNKINGYSHFEKQGITAIFKKHQNQQKHKFSLLNNEEKEKWLNDNCKSPIRITTFKAILIVYIPFILSIILRLVF